MSSLSFKQIKDMVFMINRILQSNVMCGSQAIGLGIGAADKEINSFPASSISLKWIIWHGKIEVKVANCFNIENKIKKLW